jgi:hypothetical protein
MQLEIWRLRLGISTQEVQVAQQLFVFLPSFAQPRRAERLLAFRGKDSTCGGDVFLPDHHGQVQTATAGQQPQLRRRAGRSTRNLVESCLCAMTFRKIHESSIENGAAEFQEAS